MSAGISKECFPPASKCHNCQRKGREDILENPEGRKEFNRCSGCHLLTYCDRDCQREHWQKVHKRHCGFLGGQKLVNNSQHRRENCSLCLEQSKARASEITSIMSPKTGCHIEMLVAAMKNTLGSAFYFHDENKNCKCSTKFACQLPFPLGEISGNYLGNGFDEMVAHALKTIYAIGNKDSSEDIVDLWHGLIFFRVASWTLTLIHGRQGCVEDKEFKERLSKRMENLKLRYGVCNPWWQSLFFSFNLMLEMNAHLSLEFSDWSSLDDPVFSNALKKVVIFRQSQLKNQEFITRNNLWSTFKLWPVQANEGLALLLPDGTHCQNCNSQLAGQFYVMDHDKGVVLKKKEVNLPVLMCRVDENGQLMIACSKAKCIKEILSKDYFRTLTANEVLMKNHVEDQKIFFAKARICDFCLKRSLSSHRCLECKAAQYCSTKCQREDLTFHQALCPTWAKDKLRKIVGAKHQQTRNKSFVDEYFKQ